MTGFSATLDASGVPADAAGSPAPTVGRIVHVEGPSGECLAAIVTFVGMATLALTVFAPAELPRPDEVLLDGAWHWPERGL